ncbi:MAG TPA: TIGR03086 family metal-binding protein [Streptosporangiaceae bacterium]|nr:TIGR03086 family metal-binding protein [Streptosporangiaceae bacterium]
MIGNTMASYRRAQDGFDAVLAAVPESGWDSPSACSAWTVRDVAGHVIWGQEQVRCWATGLKLDRNAGAPGAAHPGEMAGTDPVATWRAARAATVEVLTGEGLDRAVSLPGLGVRPLAAVVTLLVTDHLAHTWDIGHALNLDVPLDAELIPGSFAWARDHIVRVPGLFGPELTPPPGADEQTRWLAFLGRAAWQPVPAGS